MVIALLFAAAVQPSPESLRLGRRIAESGTLGTLLPMIQQKETDELVAAHPELTQAEQAHLRATAKHVFELGRDRLMNAEADQYARLLSVADLRAIAAFHQSRAGRRYQHALPKVIVETMQQVGRMDFKADVLATYCKQTGKLCAK